MSNGRPADRLRLGVIIALLAAFALGSFWVLEVLRRNSDDVMVGKPSNEPDYTVEKFNFVRMSTKGQARYDISGVKLTHYPLSDTFEIQHPFLNNLGQDKSSFTVRSERAIVDNINSKIHMYHNVQMNRPASDQHDHFHLQSEYLLTLPDDDIVRTDKLVDIKLGQSTLRGTGMFVNNATRELRLFNNVHVAFPAAMH